MLGSIEEALLKKWGKQEKEGSQYSEVTLSGSNYYSVQNKDAVCKPLRYEGKGDEYILSIQRVLFSNFRDKERGHFSCSSILTAPPQPAENLETYTYCTTKQMSSGKTKTETNSVPSQAATRKKYQASCSESHNWLLYEPLGTQKPKAVVIWLEVLGMPIIRTQDTWVLGQALQTDLVILDEQC